MNFTAAVMHGKLWISIDELIEFFEQQSRKEDSKTIIYDKYVSLALSSIKEKCCTDPTRIMTEEEFLKEQKN